MCNLINEKQAVQFTTGTIHHWAKPLVELQRCRDTTPFSNLFCGKSVQTAHNVLYVTCKHTCICSCAITSGFHKIHRYVCAVHVYYTVQVCRYLFHFSLVLNYILVFLPYTSSHTCMSQVFHNRSLASSQQRSELGVTIVPATLLQVYALRAKGSLNNVTGTVQDMYSISL